MSWIVIVVLVVVGIFAIKMNHLRHRIFIILLVLLALFLYISMTTVGSQNSLEFNSAEGVYGSMKIYTGWLANGFQNFKDLTGKAIKLDWTSTNGTFIEEESSKS